MDTYRQTHAAKERSTKDYDEEDDDDEQLRPLGISKSIYQLCENQV